MPDERREGISEMVWKVLTVSAASRFADEVKETVHALDFVGQVHGSRCGVTTADTTLVSICKSIAFYSQSVKTLVYIPRV